MKEKIEVTVYQHPTFEEGDLLFQEDVLSKLLEQCESIFLKTNPKNKYPREEVEQRFTQLLQAVSLEKSLHIKLLATELPWEGLLDKLKRYYPQMVWTLGKKIEGSEGEYSFEFIPLVENMSGFPFGTILSQSLIQQGIPNEGDTVEGWEQEIFYILEDYLRIETETLIGDDVVTIGDPISSVEDDSYFENESALSDIPRPLVYHDYDVTVKNETPTVEPVIPEVVLPVTGAEAVKLVKKSTSLSFTEEQAETESKKSISISEDDFIQQQLEIENEALKNEQERLVTSNKKLQEEISALNERAIMLGQAEADEIAGGNTMVLNKQALYYEEAIRRERDAKERMRVTNEKLEHLVSRLERQVMENSLDIIEGDVPYVNRSEDWYQKKHIDLLEYDQLYQKAKYLEHTWEVNQRLIVISERMTIGESEMKYERERVNRLKHSTKDIELFVMMDECRMINNRVKIRPQFLWMKPRVTIMNGDYENLVEKAAYFDVIQSENQMLEKIIDEHIEEIERESN